MDKQELIDGLNELATANFAECPACGRAVPVVDGRLLRHSLGTDRCPGGDTEPDGPPAAAPERKAGERLPVGDRFIVGADDSCDVWEATGADPVCLARDLKTADAKFLAFGHARLRALEAALRGLRYPNEPARFCDHAAEPCSRCEAARAALAAGPGT
jgi:hypothetical protein